MKFAFVIFKYFPYGGIQRDMMKLLRESQRRGHSVKVFTDASDQVTRLVSLKNRSGDTGPN